MSIVYEKVKKILTEKFSIPAEDVSLDATFEELDLDSLDLVEFALAVEEALGVRIADDEAAALESLEDTVELLQSRGARV